MLIFAILAAVSESGRTRLLTADAPADRVRLKGSTTRGAIRGGCPCAAGDLRVGVQQLVRVVVLPDESTSPAGELVPAPTGLPFFGDSGHSGNRRAPLGLRLVFTTARTSPRFATRASGWLRTSAAFAAGDFDGTGIKAPSRRGSRSFIRVAQSWYSSYGARPTVNESRNRARKAGNHFASFERRHSTNDADCRAVPARLIRT